MLQLTFDVFTTTALLHLISSACVKFIAPTCFPFLLKILTSR